MRPVRCLREARRAATPAPARDAALDGAARSPSPAWPPSDQPSSTQCAGNWPSTVLQLRFEVARCSAIPRAAAMARQVDGPAVDCGSLSASRSGSNTRRFMPQPCTQASGTDVGRALRRSTWSAAAHWRSTSCSASSSPSTSRIAVRGGERDAQPFRARGHGGAADRGHPVAALQQRMAGGERSAPRRRAAAGWMGVIEGTQGQCPVARPPLRESRGHCVHPFGASPAARHRHAQRRARGGGHARRQRRGEDVAARALQDQFDHIAPAGDKRAEAAEGLAQRAHQQRHLVAASRPASSRLPRPVAPITPSPCASSTSSQACCCARQRRQLAPAARCRHPC